MPRTAPNPGSLSAPDGRILKRLAAPDARLASDDDSHLGKGWELSHGRYDRLAVPDALISDLWRRGLLLKNADGGVRISAAGQRLVRGGSQPDASYGQHRALRRSAMGGAGFDINARESPLAWLRSRKGRGGVSLISEEEFEAGERLRADYTLAQLEPRTTASWDSVVSSGSHGRSGQKPESLSINERAIAARQRLFNALDSVGPELSGILLEICCLERGLEAAERRLGWPQRSGKLILRIALAGLARHYGLTRASQQSMTSLRHWGDEGYRPAIASEA